MTESSLYLDPAMLRDLLDSPDGPVGLVIEELSAKASEVARALAPVMRRRHFDPLHQYGPPGETKASVRSSFPRFNRLGQIYGGVNVHYGPTLFLERPARQIRTTDYMFMSDALNAVAL